jgi:peptidoglycan/xylan/chitin deacetylase (PgdA/CDA1 family)
MLARALKAFGKAAVLSPLYRTGLLRLYARASLSRKAIVLTFHRVLPLDRQRDSFSSPAIVVTPETFDMHMALVRRFFRPVTIEEFARLIKSRARLPSATCLVTFDDGWHDNYEFALPILRRHGIPAVIFVATDFIGGDRCFWQEKLARMLHAALEHENLATVVFGHVLNSSIPAAKNSDERRRAVRDIVGKMKAKPIADTLELVDAVSREVDTPVGHAPERVWGEDRFMTWEQIKEMQASGLIEIGSHAQSHTPLTKLDATSASRELAQSRSAIEANTGKDCFMFAYPNGDFNDGAVSWVARAGYSLAFTTIRGRVPRGADPLRLKRINIHEAAAPTPAHLLSRVAGLS